ncbi:biotin--protein ligase isoform X1 [Ceratitis capitata]|uniref:biotin--protein ligase isoform X1 n=1 Tax=Ceratitis capitata TaxID=7213 RepID=UPI00032A1529|nr:biotin--protein ligase isoform X1 [Ceratitis capitata]
MLTLYYATATFMQSWRMKNVCAKIGQQLALNTTISFYTLPTGSDDGFDPTLAASDLCQNRNAARVSEILWLSGVHRGCCLSPVQVVQLMPWISFDENPATVENKLLPFAHSSTQLAESEHFATLKKDKILHLLLEAGVHPSYDNHDYTDYVRIENFGKLIAWKVDSHLAVLIETDVEHFTKLLLSTYLQNNFLINDQLQLLRIESIKYEGKPQPLNLLASHMRKPVRHNEKRLSDEEWLRHLEHLRALSVLAHQATEFECQKVRVEGKTVGSAVIKPDLIPSEQKAAGFQEETKPNSSGEVDVADGVTTEKSSTTSPSAKTASTATPSKSTMVTKVPIEPTTNVKTISPLSKMRAKPTEIKKPVSATPNSGGNSAESRFKTTKVSESSTSTTKPELLNEKSAVKSTGILPLLPPDPPITISAAAAIITTTTSRAKIPSTTVASKSNDQNKVVTQIASTSSAQNQKSQPPEITAEAKPRESTSGNAGSKRPSLKRTKNALPCKPTNVFVYSESASSREGALNTLKNILDRERYTIYAMTLQQLTQKYWMENTGLLVVCGNVPTNIGTILVDYFLCGGKVLSLCSDILNIVLPNYRTAEVRENELVQFSYDKWQKIKMMHHIFCYQPSPVKKNFSTDSDDATQSTTRKPALVCPRSVELQDLHGEMHNLDVKVLGTEETWNTPSLLLANSVKSGGCAVFSQVHLETSPSQFEMDESKYNILKQNENVRLEILADLLRKHLDVSVQQIQSDKDGKCTYQEAYFLGRHESKFELLEKIKKSGANSNIITTPKLTMQFCDKGDKPKSADTNVLPILIHSCPDDFSTVDYFDNLKTNYIGRLVIYAPVISTSMNIVSDLELTDGIAVLVRQQTEGVGRSNNQWLSPMGCAMFSLQLHLSLDSQLGKRLPLVQHIIGLAMVNTLRGNPTYKDLDVRLKWPNDIYANGTQKIGGLIVKTTLAGSKVMANIGCGINLNNEKPTTCINSMIGDYNTTSRKNLPLLKYEEFIALTFNEIERLLEIVKSGDFDYFYELYYEHWLHDLQKINICDKSGKQQGAIIIGIDDIGYLKVRTTEGVIETVQPDGNSFDMLQGLIVPKFN